MHTKGQVVTESRFWITSKDGSGWLTGFTPIHFDMEEVEANARRIVALWNMADRLNLSTEFIKDGGVDEMIKLIEFTCKNGFDSIFSRLQAEDILSKMGR